MDITKRDSLGRIAKGNNIKHGLSKHRTYDCWVAMKARCFNKKNPAYKHYGARGITVCDRWLKFENFLEDMGTSDITLDRINNNGNYCKENCRWITIQAQQKNKRDNSDNVGIVFEQSRNRWRADYCFKGVRKFLGRFIKKEDAIIAREQAEKI